MSTTASTHGDSSAPAETSGALVAVAWTLVGVPLIYGLYNTVKAASALFA